jgi:DNA-directed RNA polymerase alpha subunit
MDKFSDIQIKQQLLDKKNSRLELKLQGKHLNHVIMNTLRRICMSDIPIYSFDTVEFGKNTSIFNNDYMRHRIRSIPIRSIENDNTFFEEEEFDDNIDSENNDYTTENILLNENAEIAMGNDNIGLNDEIKTEVKNTYDQVNMHISVENKNDEVRIVTTDDAKFYKDGNEIKNLYKNPLLLCKLNKNQEINFTAIAKLGIERISALYSAITIFAYKQIKKDEYQLNIESRGQINEYRILYVSCMNILKHLEYFMELIPKDNKGLTGQLDIKNMSHTIGNLIATGMLDHKDVEFAGYAKPHLLDEKIVINFTLKKSDIHSILIDVVKYYNTLFTYLAKYFEKNM